MNLVLETIKQLLSEGRIEDVKKKYPNLDPKIIDYFAQGDPSGNQKYLDWLTKAMTNINAYQTVEEIIDNWSYEDGYWGDVASYLLELVTKFHNLLPYLVHEENGQKVGTTDLYAYKFTDSETIHYLKFDIDRAQERKEGKEKLKKLSSEADKIYEDKDWLVVRPKTWEASCHYGAGTRWCTTNKQSSSHFKRETDRNFLIYVIDKNLDERNEYYKVAWQIPYLKQINSYMKFDMNSGWEVDYTKIKLWDAKDTNFARFGSEGIDYLASVPKKVKASILKYMQAKMDEMYGNMAYVDDPHIQALVEYLGLSPEEVEGIIKSTHGYYSMKEYTVTEHGDYAVANEDELETSKEEWAQNYVDDVGYADAVSHSPETYVHINEINTIAAEDADNYIDDIRDDDLLDYAKGYSKKIDDKIEEYEINQGIYDGLDDDISDLMLRFQNEEISKEEYDEELEELEKEKESLEQYQPRLFEKIRSMYRDSIYEHNVDEMSNNTLDWLKNMGWATKDGISEEAFERGVVGVDTDRLVTDIVNGLDPSVFGESIWEEVNIGGETYYIFPLS